MATELTTALTFEEKMRQRIRESIGDLIDDAALAKIVERGIDEAFFKWGEEPDRYGYGAQPRKVAPWIVKMMQEEVRHQAQKAVGEWVAANSDKLAAIAKETLENDIARTTISVFARLWQEPLELLRTQLADKFEKLGNSAQYRGDHPCKT